MRLQSSSSSLSLSLAPSVACAADPALSDWLRLFIHWNGLSVINSSVALVLGLLLYSHNQVGPDELLAPATSIVCKVGR